MIAKEFVYPALETDRLRFEVLTLEHAEEVFNLFSDPEVTRFMDIEPCKELKEAEVLILEHQEDIGVRWGIFDKANHLFLGTIGFHYIRQSHDKIIAEVGYDLAKKFWGKGYMTEALKAVIDFGFLQMNLTTIDATVEPENMKSIVLLENLGFEKAADLQDNLVYYALTK